MEQNACMKAHKDNDKERKQKRTYLREVGAAGLKVGHVDEHQLILHHHRADQEKSQGKLWRGKERKIEEEGMATE